MEINCCRICGCKNLNVVMDLGEQSLGSRFPGNGEPDPPVYPLVLVQCKGECGLVQLKHNTPPDEMYTRGYGYRSGLNNTMVTHLQGLAQDAMSKAKLEHGDVILDIGSNDCTLLKSYNLDGLVGIQKIGFDPTGSQFESFYPIEVKLANVYFSADIYNLATYKKAKIITTVSMFYDLPDPMKVVNDIKSILDPEGVWISEQSYLITMLEKRSFDTICHEHLEYYAIKQFKYMAEKAGLKIVDISFNECNGGSFRLTLAHKDSKMPEFIVRETEVTPMLPVFVKECLNLRTNMVNLLTDIRNNNKTVYVCGASTKGNTLLQFYKLGGLIKGASERNPDKWGKRTPGTNIPIVSEAEARYANPDYFLVLPWHFKQEIMEREATYLANGGQLIFPLPNVSIVSSKKKP